VNESKENPMGAAIRLPVRDPLAERIENAKRIFQASQMRGTAKAVSDEQIEERITLLVADGDDEDDVRSSFLAVKK
jgi:hypothetical protein